MRLNGFMCDTFYGLLAIDSLLWVLAPNIVADKHSKCFGHRDANAKFTNIK